MVEGKKEVKKDNANLILWIIIGILIIGGIGIYYGYKARLSKVLFDYNGFPVKKVRDGGRFFYDITVYVNEDVAPTIISIREEPKSLEGIGYESEAKANLIGKEKIYMTMEPSATGISVAAYTEFKWILESIYAIKTQGALLEEVEGSPSPKKTCDDVSEENGVVMLRKAEENRVYVEDGCVIIDAVSENDRIRGVYRLTLTMLGVMNE